MQFDYSVAGDIDLITRAKRQDNIALDTVIKRYLPVIESVVKAYFIPGADYDDLHQEALIGFINALFNYSEEQKTKFSTFAILCIKRQIINAVKSANSLKNEPLNKYVSYSSDEAFIIDSAGAAQNDKIENPEKYYIDKEKYTNLLKLIENELSDYELQVFSLYIERFSYDDIGNKLGRSGKSIDNAVQRIKKKLANVLRS